MSIHFETRVEGNLLKARAWGADDDLEDVKRYGMAMVSACLDGGCNMLLLAKLRRVYADIVRTEIGAGILPVGVQKQ